MIYLLFELNNSEHPSASVWIDTDDMETARKAAEEKLVAAGYPAFSLLDAMASTEDDYFPPCNGLDAFKRAEKDGFAINFD